MNPTVGIENIKYNEHVIEYNITGENSMISRTLFDVKFDNLKNDYLIKNENKVYEFIRDNENVFNLLEEVKPSLRKNFGNEKYYLEVQCYPEIYKDELALVILTNPHDDPDEITKKFLEVSLSINESQIELGLIGKFFITLECA